MALRQPMMPATLSRRGLLLGAATGMVAAVVSCSGDDRNLRREVADVSHFGARGNGADDSEAFRRAVRHAEQHKIAVWIPRGRFLLSEDGRTLACLRLPTGVKLMGEGVLAFASHARTSCKLIRIDGQDVSVRQVSLDLSDAPAGTSFGISVGPLAQRVHIVDVTLRDNPHRGGIQITGGQDIRVQRCQILRMRQNGITLYGATPGRGPTRIFIDSCHITADVQPLDSEPVNGAVCRDVTVSNSVLVSTGSNYSLTLAGTRDAVVRKNVLRGAVDMTRAVRAIMSDNVINASVSSGLNAVHATYDSRDCTVRRNRIVAAPGRTGVWVARGGTEMPEGWSVEQNRISVEGAGSTGVYASDVRSMRIVDNILIGDRAASGITVVATQSALEAEVRHNDVSGFLDGVVARSSGSGVLVVDIRANSVRNPVSGRATGLSIEGRRTRSEVAGNRLTRALKDGGLRVDR